MEQDPNASQNQEQTHTQKVLEPSSHQKVEKVEHQEAKVLEKSQQVKNETIQKVEEPHQKQDELKKQIKQTESELHPNVTESEINKAIEQVVSAEAYLKPFQQSKSYSQLQGHFKKLTEILTQVNTQKSSLQINLGIGQNKGKSSIRGSLSLANNKDDSLEVSLEVKIKKKLQLKSLIEGQIKKWHKQQSFHMFKLCKVEVLETDKGLKISIHSPIFQKQVCKDIIKVINELYENGANPVLKVEGELTIKNSIRNDQAALHKKKFMKWLFEGFTSHLLIQGSTGIIQYFTSPISEFFPIFKISLKTKNITSVDKFFEKLGINEISQQTPTLHAFFGEILKENLSSQSLPWVPELMKKCLHFASTIPNERISIDVIGHLSHLHFQLSIASEACKELGDIIATSTTELFS